jgi:hypothetical protein
VGGACEACGLGPPEGWGGTGQCEGGGAGGRRTSRRKKRVTEREKYQVTVDRKNIKTSTNVRVMM